jgi:single-strand DNA-binding protein
MAIITIVGNLVDAPELKYTASGKAVANFTVAESRRVKDGDGSWKDGPSTFWRCSIWDAAAENMAESLVKGQRVIVVGEVAQRSFETQAGEKRSVFEIAAQEVGPSLKWATAKVEKTAGKPSGFASKPSKPDPVADDPWGSAPADVDPPF